MPAADRDGRIEELLDRIRSAGDAGRPQEAVALAERALTLLGTEPGDSALRATVLVNLGCNLADLGRMDQSMTVFDEAARIDPAQRGEVESARGLVLHLARRSVEALAALDQALDGWTSPNRRAHCAAHIRRGSVHLALGDVTRAEADYGAAAALAADLGVPVLEFMARHNLGYVLFVRGDLPGALREMEAARAASGEDAPEGVPLMDRARVLLDAGLLQEAGTEIERAIEALREAGAGPELVEAHLLHASWAMTTGDHGAAADHAVLARQIAEGAALRLPALSAELQTLTARAAVGAPAGEVRAEALRLADALARSALREEASAARLVAAAAAVELGEPELARADLAAAPVLPQTSTPLRLQRQVLQARVAITDGDPATAFTELNRGLDELSEFSAAFGSTDMQAAAAVHGLSLARTGLRLAVDSGDPALILAWLERSRAVTTRLPPVRPPDDPVLADLLSQVRLAADRQREARASGAPDADLDARIQDLRMRIRSRTWTVGGHGRPADPLSLTQVQERLGQDPTRPTVVAYLIGRGALHALVVTASGAWFRELGHWEDRTGRQRRLQADLDLLAAPRIPDPLRAVARASVDRQLVDLDRALLEPLQDVLGTGPLVVAAVGDLATLPWLLLPSRAHREVTVHSSVTAALRDQRPEGRLATGPVTAVAGPDAAAGEGEGAEVARIHGETRTLVGAAATASAVLDSLPAGGLLHIAAHGHHDSQSPLFSHVSLADGPLYGYDFSPRGVPDQVVLSACDVGRSSLRPGNEPLGLAAALLRYGVGTVVAGVTRVGDEVASATMASYHRSLASGQRPAAALAHAVTALREERDELAAFTCFGVVASTS